MGAKYHPQSREKRARGRASVPSPTRMSPACAADDQVQICSSHAAPHPPLSLPRHVSNPHDLGRPGQSRGTRGMAQMDEPAQGQLINTTQGSRGRGQRTGRGTGGGEAEQLGARPL